MKRLKVNQNNSINMKITINPKNSRIFATLLDILSNIVDELNIEFQTDKIYIQTMDTGRISLFELILDREWFECFEVEKNTVIGLKLSIINKILNCRDPSQSIEFQFDKETSDKIKISLLDGSKGTFNKTYETSVYDFENDHLSIPAVDADAELTIDSIVMYKLFEQLKNFGDNIKISCNEDDIRIETIESADFTGMKVEIPEDDILEYSIIEDANVIVEYHITPICKALAIARLSKDDNITNELNIYISPDSPIMIKFNMFKKSSVTFWIAPKLSLDN